VDTSCPSAQEEVYPGATAKSRMKVVFSAILIRFVSLQTVNSGHVDPPFRDVDPPYPRSGNWSYSIQYFKELMRV